MISSPGKKNRNTFDVFQRINYHILNESGKLMPIIESHRGSKYQPENTLLAFQSAIQIGCEAVELDIWLTKDKVPVIIHGTDTGDISKTTNGSGIFYLLVRMRKRLNI